MFNPENGLWRTVSAIGDIVGLSFCWLFCSLPIITLGPASCALYVAVCRYTRKGEAGAFKAFFRSFRQNLKIGIPAGLIAVLFSVFILWCCWISFQMIQSGNSFAYAVLYGLLAAFFFLIGMMCYWFPTLGSFEYSFPELMKISFSLSVAHLPTTLILAAVAVLSALGIWYNWCLLAFIPGCAALIASFFLEKVYKKHSPAETPEKEETE